MSDTDKLLYKIARGTGIIFVGTIISMFFGFVSRTIIARHFTISEYGIFSLIITIVSIILVLTSLGLPDGVVREISFYKERDPSKVKEIISTTFSILSINSVVFLILTFFFSDVITQFFHNKEIEYFLKIVSFVIPFSAINGIIISFSRGFGRVKEQVYFNNILYPILYLILILSILFFNLPFVYVFYTYVLSQVFTTLALIAYIYRLNLFKIKFSLNLKIGKELVLFSLPLLIINILGFVVNWTDTLMLGYYKSSDLVGIYNVASPLARLITIFLSSTAFLYPAMASQLYAKRKIQEMGRIYQILTKWTFLLTLPIFSIMFLFPEATISFIFGEKYVSASQTLRILSLTFMFHTFLGLNGASLVVLKESRFIMIASFISAILNIILNALLIPSYGIIGAAYASLVSYGIGNILNSIRLYQRTKIHPFSLNYVKPLVISFILLWLIQSLHIKVSNIWYTIPILIIFFLVYFILILLSKSVDREDIELFLTIEKNFGVNLGIIKKLLKKFI